MKKVLFILTVVFALALVSCGPKKAAVDVPDVDSTTVVVDTVKVQ